jgi:hypothetical protein
MRKILIGLLVIMTLVGCGTTNSDTSSTGSDGQVFAETADEIRLRDDYEDALSIQGQLAAGTLLLEETELAVDEVMAVELLPLWRAAQSLMNSDTAAALEIEAVYNQVQDTMTPDQISAIAEMELTEEALTTMMEEGDLDFGRGGFAEGRGDRTGTGEGFTPPEGGFRPGGGFLGGPPGEGPGGGFPEGINPEVIATRQAQFAEGGLGSFMDRALIPAVIRTLEMKTGEVSADQPVRPFDIVYSVIAETTSLSLEEIRAMTTEGMTLAEIVETNAGDLEEVRNLLIEALSELPNAADLDLEQLASEWLGLDE